MLGLRRNRWRTVTGGSRVYVEALLRHVDGSVHLGAPVRSLRRTEAGVELRCDDDVARPFDGVVVATSAPRALALLEDPSPEEQVMLSAFETTSNETVLHTDARLLPRRGSNRSSWNYQSPGCGVYAGAPSLTYSLNRLQQLESPVEHCVTLNRTAEIDASTVLRVIEYEHPRVTFSSLRAAEHARGRGAVRQTAFAGAWQGNGFHEDGLTSGLRAATAFGGGLVRSALYLGTVMHARRSPRRHVFRYPVYMALVDLDELTELDRRLPLFGWNRRALTSFHDDDHIDVRATLAEHGVELRGRGSIQVLTNLRVLGYVFNPVSFWWCRHDDGELACVVAEVNNTFGERHAYVLHPAPAARTGARASGRLVVETEKLLHVSPFMPMDQSYTWWLSEPGEHLSIRMDVHEPGRRDFHATLTARRRPLTARGLRSVLVRYPLMPAAVTLRIHVQALRLWSKRVRVHHKPPFVPGRGSVKR